MNGKTVESIFGTNAGIVWEALSKNGPNSISDLVKITSLSREEISGALGWLGRESKIQLERRGRGIIFSLSESEAHRAGFKGRTTADFAPDSQSLPRTSTRKKRGRARKAKTASSSPEALKRALGFILSELEASREPTPSQVSNESGIGSKQLGKALSKLDIRSKSVRRGSKSARIYPLALKPRIWELAALDEDGLQKMISAREKAIQDEKEHNKEQYSVFD